MVLGVAMTWTGRGVTTSMADTIEYLVTEYSNGNRQI